jgi:hypothetical protein
MNRKNPSFAHAKEGWLYNIIKQIQFNPSVPVLWIKADIWLILLQNSIVQEVQFYKILPITIIIEYVWKRCYH